MIDAREMSIEIDRLRAELKRDHEHMKQALVHKMKERAEMRDYLIEVAMRLRVLPEHADTHLECYSEKDLIDALVQEIEDLRE